MPECKYLDLTWRQPLENFFTSELRLGEGGAAQEPNQQGTCR